MKKKRGKIMWGSAAVIAFLAVMACVFGYVIFWQYSTKRIYLEADYHLLAASVSENPAVGEGNDGEVFMSPQNLSDFITAISRTGAKIRFKKFELPEEANVTVTFPDGAVYRLYDWGTDENAKDVCLITVDYSGKRKVYTLTGYRTIQRSLQCTSLEGYRAPNEPAESN